MVGEMGQPERGARQIRVNVPHRNPLAAALVVVVVSRQCSLERRWDRSGQHSQPDRVPKLSVPQWPELLSVTGTKREYLALTDPSSHGRWLQAATSHLSLWRILHSQVRIKLPLALRDRMGFLRVNRVYPVLWRVKLKAKTKNWVLIVIQTVVCYVWAHWSIAESVGFLTAPMCRTDCSSWV